ncbi:hypothetical protein A1O1_02621 [Capronia coronata CBS 617.96]|uniref:tRNA-splicing endonuclease subunit Sen54 N-terminal domain-containing protein n=1 Tax=Capronia coronata CBS 617.96 TaxID=1182541 RepID=W9YNT7_9EURO|nr:uncharacterized protein A1O1_02621 [Capronia coronata CBS 617.96]EXJ94228.1 hypothetical protein A1O1_02621 [Capronia coronata CBS 617.96]
MADADEDAIPTTSHFGAEDLEDETQDFRFLAQLTSSSSSGIGQAIIPKRGTKDFEPNPTRSQASALDAARLAMHTALSAVRVHAGKNHLVGQFLPNEEDWRWDENGSGVRHGRCVVVYKFKSTHLKVMGQADRNNWVWLLPEEALFLLERGSLDIRWPDPLGGENDGTSAALEETIHAVSEGDFQHQSSQAGSEPETATETSTPAEQSEIVHAESSLRQEDPEVCELPMSLQGAYASFIGKDGLTLERYSVYAGLKRAGYVVQRAPTWHDTDPAPVNGHADDQVSHGSTHNAPTTTSSSSASTSTLVSSQPSRPFAASPASLIHRLVSWLFRPRQGESCPSLGPLVAPGLYRNYADIFRALALIPYHDPTNSPKTTTVTTHSLTGDTSTPTSLPSTTSDDPSSSASTRNPQPPFRVHFHVWKPSGAHAYRKTAPPPPDYRIAVVDARTTSLPTLTQIGDLLDSQPEDALSRDKAGRLETRIKHGRRNVLLAVVDMGVISYLRLSDACFGVEKLFEEKAKAGSKGRGKGKGPGKGGWRGKKGQTQGQAQKQPQENRS